MSSVTETMHEEAAVLTRAVETLLRKLSRFLVGRMSLVSLVEILKKVFVEETENRLREENPGKNVSLTKLGLLCGLDTRTLIKIRNGKTYRQSLSEESSFLRESTPGASIIDLWSSKPPYFDARRNRPKALSVSGKEASFEALFHECGQPRGVTYTSLLQRLVESGAVKLDKKKSRVELVLHFYLPSASKDKLGAIEMGFSALASMTETVTFNISALENGGDRLYQRGAWTYRISPENRDKLRSQLRVLLESTDARAREIISKFEDPVSRPNHLTIGVSQFYFEEKAH